LLDFFREGGRAEMSELRRDEARPRQQRSADSGGDHLPASSLSELSQDVHHGTDGTGDGRADGGGDGAGDPAFAFFRSDFRDNWSQRPGYDGTDGFAKYLKQFGILSPSKQYRITEKEITGLDLDSGELDDRTSEWDALEKQLLGLRQHKAPRFP
jgi:hypothetical protein